MAHFAKIGSNDIVEAVYVVPDEYENNFEEFQSLMGWEGEFIQTSYNHKIRGVFAGIGSLYDRVNDIFVQLPRPKKEEGDEPIS